MNSDDNGKKQKSDENEQGYKLAKLLREGNRELAQQLNTKKSQKQR